MRCPKCGNEFKYDTCLYCIQFNPKETTATSAPTASTLAFTSTIANNADSYEIKCQNCGQMILGKNNGCHYCNGILKCGLCRSDIQSTSFLEFKEFRNLSSTNPRIYKAIQSFPVTRNHRSTIRTNSGCKIVAYHRVFEGVRVEHVCETCLNNIREISFTGCILEGMLPTMQNLKKLSFSRCKIFGILPNMMLNELHLVQCEFGVGIIEFISSVPVVVPIVWEFVFKDMDEIFKNVRQMRNRLITIRIHDHDSIIRTERLFSLLPEAIYNTSIIRNCGCVRESEINEL